MYQKKGSRPNPLALTKVFPKNQGVSISEEEEQKKIENIED